MTNLTDDMRAEMRIRAEAATPRPWYRTGAPWFLAEDAVLAGSPDGNVGFVIADCDCFSSRDEYEGDIQLARPEDDAAHIVAACPANVLALLDERDRLERERDEARGIGLLINSAFSEDANREVEILANLLRAQNSELMHQRACAEKAEAALATERERTRVLEELVGELIDARPYCVGMDGAGYAVSFYGPQQPTLKLFDRMRRVLADRSTDTDGGGAT